MIEEQSRRVFIYKLNSKEFVGEFISGSKAKRDLILASNPATYEVLDVIRKGGKRASLFSKRLNEFVYARSTKE